VEGKVKIAKAGQNYTSFTAYCSTSLLHTLYKNVLFAYITLIEKIIKTMTLLKYF